MLFDSHFWPMAMIFATLSAAFAFFLGSTASSTKQRSRHSDDDTSKKSASTSTSVGMAAAIVTFFVDLIVQRVDLYYAMPSFTGSFFGYFAPVFCALVPAIIIGCIFAGGNGKAVLRSIVAVLVLFGWPLGQSLYNSFGPDNAKAYASLPNVHMAAASETIPPTDEQHLVQVTPDMAALKAKTVLSSKGNYSTRYAIGNLTLQAIKGHRYYAAPLVPTNAGDTYWTPLFGGRTESPGYVLVDAEDKEAQPELRDGFHITVFEDMPFGMKLERFVYQAGWDRGTLDNATFEVDDDFQPHWTITYVTPAFGNIVGKKISKVLVVDVANAEPVVHAYDQGDPAIKWVDRVVSSDLVKTYANDWGVYGQAYSNQSFGNWFKVWIGISKQDTMVPADGDNGLMLSYTKDEHSIWVVPMTSQNSTDHGVIGVLVFETDQNKATFYPSLRGFNHGGSVAQTMAGAKDNQMFKYSIENLELYNIYGHLTWVAIYTKPQTLGSTFGAIGFMDARSQEVSDVAYGTDLQSALADYANKLAQGSSGMAASQANQTVSFHGRIWRIAPNGTSWRFQLVGDGGHYFDVNTQTYPGTPLLRDGDEVEGSYQDLHQVQAAVHTLSLVGAGAGEKRVEEPKK
jgi:hypothetical protein